MAVQVAYRNVEDLAAVWCEYAEMEIRAEQYDKARQVMREATAMPKERAAYHDSVSLLWRWHQILVFIT